MTYLLEVDNLHVEVEGKEILKGLSLTMKEGEIHAIMGPNGAGKSTLSYTLAGRKGYEITSGRILLKGQEIHDMSADERARAGLFLSFQYPVEIPGVTGMMFLQTALEAHAKERGEELGDRIAVVKSIRAKARDLGVSEELLKRPLNVGFSGGEKKRHEVLQMAVLEPSLAILDEIDSGLDIDALRIVSEGVNRLRSNNNGFLMITHYQRLLDYVVPDFIHVLSDGKIVKTGDKTLAHELEEKGYKGV